MSMKSTGGRSIFDSTSDIDWTYPEHRYSGERSLDIETVKSLLGVIDTLTQECSHLRDELSKKDEDKEKLANATRELLVERAVLRGHISKYASHTVDCASHPSLQGTITYAAIKGQSCDCGYDELNQNE